MSKNNLIQIGGELVNTVGDGIVADAAAVKDYNKNKTQQTINSELTASVENISRSVPSSGNVVKIESQQGNSVLVLKNEDGTEVSTIVGAADRYSGWEQGGDTRIPTIGLVKEKLTAIVDTALSTTSENAVQNKVVTTALAGKQATISDLSTIRSGATAGATAVQPAAMNTAMAGKQDTISDLATIRSNAAAAADNTGDKAYNAADFSGLGRVNLQKNIVEVSGTDKNVLTQAMMNTANTIYHIQYDYDLNGQTITLPAGCVLEFDGGSLNNGVLNIANGLQIQGFAKIDAEVTATGAYGDKTCDIYLNGVAHNNPITYTEVRYAQKYSCVLNLAYAHNTPSRYGAKCDGVTDDTNALQCSIDVIGWDYGELDLRVQTTEGKAGFLITSPLQIKYKPTGQDDENYKSRQRITRIFSDNYQENDNLYPTIIAKNLESKRAAIELLGYSNGVDSSTSMDYVYIDAKDDTNDALSFALTVRDSKLNVFKNCRFVGKNGVLDLGGHSANDIHAGVTNSYSKICMTWQNCHFFTTSNSRGYSYTNGTFLELGMENGDNTLFLSCMFYGLSELHATSSIFINCMWAVKQGKDKGTAGSLGYITDQTSWKYSKNINFNDAVSIMRMRQCTFINCYYEDYENGIVVNGVQTSQYYLNNNEDSILIEGCGFNGYTNQYDGNNQQITSNSGIYVAEGLGDRVMITVNSCRFRDFDESKSKYLFQTAPIVNYNRHPIYCNNFHKTKWCTQDKNIGNIVFDNTPKMRKFDVFKIPLYENAIYNGITQNKEGYKNLAVIIGPFENAPSADVGTIRIKNRQFANRNANGYPVFNDLTTAQTFPIFNNGNTTILTDGTRSILVSQSLLRNEVVYTNAYAASLPMGVYTEANNNLYIATATTDANVVGKLCRAIMCQELLQLTFDEAYSLLTEGAENVITKANIPSSMKAGFSIIDNGRPIWWNGSAWVDATGTAV